jgi:hypothetical protein
VIERVDANYRDPILGSAPLVNPELRAEELLVKRIVRQPDPYPYLAQPITLSNQSSSL